MLFAYALLLGYLISVEGSKYCGYQKIWIYIKCIIKARIRANYRYLTYSLIYFTSGQDCVDRDFCSALQNSGKKCDAELKQLCPVYCGMCPGVYIIVTKKIAFIYTLCK